MSNPAFKFDHVHIISENPRASAEWYVAMFGATITADTMARSAPQIFVDLGGMTTAVVGDGDGRRIDAEGSKSGIPVSGVAVPDVGSLRRLIPFEDRHARGRR